MSQDTLASQRLIDALSNPREPIGCWSLLLGCIETLLDKQRFRMPPAVLDKVAEFLTTPRTALQTDDLQKRLACRCDQDEARAMSSFDQKMHTKGLAKNRALGPDSGPYLETLVDSLAQSVGFSLSLSIHGPNLHKEKKRRKFFERQGKAVPWPESFAQAVPNGHLDSIRALACWMDLPGKDELALSIMDYMAQLMRVGRQAVSPYITGSPVLWKNIFDFVEGAQSRWNRDLKNTHGSTSAVRLVKENERLVEELGQFLSAFYTFIDSEQRRWFVREMPAIIRVTGAVLRWIQDLQQAATTYRTPAPDTQRTWTQLQSWAHWICLWHCETMQQASTLFPRDIVAAAQQQAAWIKHPVGGAFYALYDMHHAHRCAAPGCNATYTDAGRTFAACSGCKRVPYCSRACQRAAWRHPAAPHRRVCAKIRVVQEKGGLPRDIQIRNDMSTFFNRWKEVIDVDMRAGKALQDVAQHSDKLQYEKLFPPGFLTEAQWLSTLENETSRPNTLETVSGVNVGSGEGKPQPISANAVAEQHAKPQHMPEMLEHGLEMVGTMVGQDQSSGSSDAENKEELGSTAGFVPYMHMQTFSIHSNPADHVIKEESQQEGLHNITRFSTLDALD